MSLSREKGSSGNAPKKRKKSSRIHFIIKSLRFDYEKLFTFGYMSKNPHRQLLLGYFSYIVIGTLLLCLPFAVNTRISLIDNMFNIASAVSTTGLATVDVSADYTFFGQLVILLFIQLGGLGYMTISSFVMFRLTKHFTTIKRGILTAEFSTPGDLKIQTLLQSIVTFTVLFEVIGAIVLYFLFSKSGASDPVWAAIFHSISAFCTAGFSTFPDNLVGFSDNWGVNLTVMALSYSGAMGFIVMLDLWKKLTVKGYQITFTTKNILVVTLVLTLWGTTQMYFQEPVIESFAPGHRFLVSIFQTMSSLTTVGFNTVNLGNFLPITLLTLTSIMYFGASPSGTGGGLKSTTITAVLAFVKSKLGKERDVSLMGKRLPTYRVDNALTTFVLYTSVLFFGSYILTMVEPGDDYIPYLFESASALGTAGLSTGISSQLTDPGKCIIILLMYIGRVGVLTIGFSMLKRMQKRAEPLLKDDDLAV